MDQSSKHLIKLLNDNIQSFNVSLAENHLPITSIPGKHSPKDSSQNPSVASIKAVLLIHLALFKA